ncbi:MAG: N-acetylglucosamine-6-phosphate deacetylase [Elusimicrobiota bacterium]|jgi:N-acetylglucosamine-6-phosphate deacetylase|nr:N-acetylglucosamine-6-phosphate deacetylase [Elusimicrobiota bacterium]
MYALTNGLIFDGWKFIDDKSIIIDEGTGIVDIVDDKVIAKSLKRINVDGAIICAGFIDVQINGCGGVLFNDDISSCTLETMFKTCLKFATTGFVPTLITASEADIKKAVEVAKTFYKNPDAGLLALHIEGPFISPQKSGTHAKNLIRKLDADIVDFLCKEVKEIPIILTVAPEEQDLTLIRKLSLGGVKVSMGHTNANYAQCLDGFVNGITMATHLFNTMTPFEGRSPGGVGAVLANDIYAGIIVDGFHSDFASVSFAKKVKGDKLYIVTDAATSMGTKLKEFNFGGYKVFVKDGICRNEAGALAGSNIDMLSSVANAVTKANIPLIEALRMATLYPAQMLGIANKIGIITKGAAANLAVFDDKFKHKRTIFNGKFVNLKG